MGFQRPENEEEIILSLLILLLEDGNDSVDSHRFKRQLFDRLEYSGPRFRNLMRFLDSDRSFNFRSDNRGLYEVLIEYFRGKDYWDRYLDVQLHRLLDRRGSRSRYIENRFDEFEARLLRKESSNEDKFSKELNSRIKKLEDNNNKEFLSINGEVHLSQWRSSIGVQESNAALRRYIPVRIYIADPIPKKKELDKITSELDKYINEIGFFVCDDFPPEEGSWWKRLFYKAKDAITHDEVIDRAKNAEKSLKAKHLDIPEAKAKKIRAEAHKALAEAEKAKAEASKTQVDAASSLIASLGTIDAACIQAGSILLVKAKGANGDSAIISRNLCQSELQAIEENPTILSKPNDILRWLENIPNREVLE